jgi:hypothetical protein
MSMSLIDVSKAFATDDQCLVFFPMRAIIGGPNSSSSPNAKT